MNTEISTYFTSFVGIDPGKSGSVCLAASNLIQLSPTPLIGKEYDIKKMYELLKGFNTDSTLYVIERAQPMPKQGVCSMFEFGKGYGIWLAILGSLETRHIIVHSRTWTKVMLAGAPGEGKDRAFHVARKLFPQWQPKLKKEYQYADSILLAEYGRMLYSGKSK